MKYRRWLGFLRSNAAGTACLGVLPRAAASEKSFDALLEVAVRNLMSAGDGQRAGVWLEQQDPNEAWCGLMLTRTAEPVSETWPRLDVSRQLGRQIIEAQGFSIWDGPAIAARCRFAGLQGMNRVLWMPLRARSAILGLAMVAWEKHRISVDLETLKTLASEVALLASEERSRQRFEQAQQEIQAREGLHRAIRRGAARGRILDGVASAAMRHTHAQFVALARRVAAELRWEVFAGNPAATALLSRASVAEAARTPLHSGEAVVLELTAGFEEANAQEPPAHGVSAVVALPLQENGDASGVLLAGYAPTAAGLAHRLEPYATLASAALAKQRQSDWQQESETAYQALFESAREALLIVDSEGVVQKASRRARELLRLRSETAPQLPLSGLFSEAARDTIVTWCEQAREGLAPSPVEAALETGFPMRLSLRSVLDPGRSLLVCLEESSVAQRADEKWKQVEAELRSVLDSIESGILLLDLSGRIRFTNARFAQLFSLDARSLAKLSDYEELAQLIHDRFAEPQAFSARWRSFSQKAGEAAQDELEVVRPAHKVFERFSRPVLDALGRPLGWLELYRDVTSQKQIQSKLLQTEKMAALGQLVSGIAHELNNPLTAIMGYAQLLLGHGLGPSQLAEARKIYQEAERARRIVKNLLFFAREARPERSRVDLNEIVERTLTLRSYELKIENIVVECELERDLPATLADPYQLQQVVLNLLVNAEQAILQGRGHGHIWIRSRRLPGDRLGLEMADDGPGVPPEIASRVFDPFFTTKPPGVGTGLGLSIVYGIVHQHGGDVVLENRRKGGAKFTVELPVVRAPAERPSEGELKLAAAVGAVPGRILVVEDEPTVAQLIADVLREEGHQVEAVLDSQEGLTRISRGRYDLVICDLRMPRLDGPAFYDTLVRARSPAQHRIIFITGDTLAPRTMEFLERTGLPYLAKPFLVEELKLAANRLLEQTRLEEGEPSPVSPSRPAGSASETFPKAKEATNRR